MKLWIPNIGDAFRLDADWTFRLHGERRNDDLYNAETGKKINVNYLERRRHELDVTLPVDTELVVDRVYIRQGDDDGYASVTFVLKRYPDKSKVEHFGARFWAKLADVNRIECTPTDTGNPVGPMSKGRYRLLALPDDEAKKRLAKAARAKANKEELEAVVTAMKEKLDLERRHNPTGAVRHHLAWMKAEIEDACEAYCKRQGYSGWKSQASWQAKELYSGLFQTHWTGKRKGPDFSPKSTSRRKDGTTVRKFVWSGGYYVSGLQLPGFVVTSRGAEILNIEPMETNSRP